MLDWLGQNGAAARPEQEVERVRLPHGADQRKEADRDGHHEQGGDQHAARADAVGERARDEARAERGRRVDRRREPGEPERDAAHVVQVDDRNGRTMPFPKAFVRPPTCSTQTGRGSCGFRLRT